MQGQGIKKTESKTKECVDGLLCSHAVIEGHIPCRILTVSRQSCYSRSKDKESHSACVCERERAKRKAGARNKKLTREVELSDDLILEPGPRTSAACTLGCLGVRRFAVEGESRSAT